MSAEMGRRIVDLGGARPIDVLVLEGAAPVIRAVDGAAQGAYA